MGRRNSLFGDMLYMAAILLQKSFFHVKFSSTLRSVAVQKCLQSIYSSSTSHGSANPTSSPSPKAETFMQRLVVNAPARFQPYLLLSRLDRPVGSWLLFLPCSWSIALATEAGHWPSLYYVSLFATGSLIMRAAGCVINDMWDKDFDKLVERTKSRPLACGRVSTQQALTLLAGQLSVSLLILLQFNWFTVGLGLSSIFLVATYPLFKRVTYWPQLMLGFTFNWGVLMGYSAVLGHCNWSVCLPLYVAAVNWTLFYDTIYAHQDKADDIRIGVKSTALLFGESTKKWLSGFTLATGSCLLACGYNCDAGLFYYLGVSGMLAHLWKQIYSVQLDSVPSCLKTFQSNRTAGLLLLSGIVLDRYTAF